MAQIVPKDGILPLRSGNSCNYVSAQSLSQNKTSAGAIITFLYFHWLCRFWRVFFFVCLALFYIPTRQIMGTWEPWGCVSVCGNISRRCNYSVLVDDLRTHKLSSISSGPRRQGLIKPCFIWFKVLEERRNK